QNPRENSQWFEWFQDERERIQWTNRLANLALLSGRKNSKAGNFALDEKLDVYFKDKMSNYGITVSIMPFVNKNKNMWTPLMLEARQKEFLSELKHPDVWDLD